MKSYAPLILDRWNSEARKKDRQGNILLIPQTKFAQAYNLPLLVDNVPDRNIKIAQNNKKVNI